MSNILTRILSTFKKEPEPVRRPLRRRGFDAAGTGRLLSSWTTDNTSADYDIYSDLEKLRARSRQLVNNNDYARRYISLCATNVIGANGIKLQSKVQNANGKYDKTANYKIESAWKEWGKSKNCSVDGMLTWRDVQRICIETAVRDGEIIVWVKEGFRNDFKFAVQLLEADHLDIQYNDIPKRIKMGIEYNEYGRPIAYHLFTKHPGDRAYSTMQFVERVRIPATEIIHLFYRERPSQTRGIPWMHSAMTRLNHVGAYEEAELIAARVGASKMGFILNPDGEQYQGDEDSDGNIEIEAEPGTFEQLPVGYDFKEWDPTHPSGNFGPFMKTTLRGIASGMNISYPALANDLEGANYSSLRAGTIEERDAWKVKQQWFIDTLCTPIFERWLTYALLTRMINLPFDRYDKYNTPAWFARSWQWVDPLKDSKAAIEEINAGIRTRTDTLAEQGKDFEDIVDTLRQEMEMLKDAGITITTGKPAETIIEEDDKDGN